ncbi:MAG: tetratricopeptide repeat protein [Anaerolineae bacterium]|nr:tetratricopeptide repeat protein [Gloeobacterales cyanobacterium ES-bin-313]
MSRQRKILVPLSLMLCLAGTLMIPQRLLAQSLSAEQVDSLVKQCETKFKAYEYQAALPLCLNASIAAEQSNNPKTLSTAYSFVSRTYFRLGNYQKYAEYQNKRLQIALQTGNKKDEAIVYGNLGVAFEVLGNPQKALELHNKALQIALEIGDKSVQADDYGNLANVYLSLGDYQKAITFYQKQLQLTLEINDKEGESNAYSGLGNAYQSLADYPKSIEFQSKSLELALQRGDKNTEGAAYTNLGNTYYYLGNYQKAAEFHLKRLQISLQTGDKEGEESSYLNLGNINDSLGNYPKAIDFLTKALQIAKKIGDKKTEGKVYGNLGNVYSHVGEYRKAIEFHNQRLKVAQETSDRQGEANAYGNLGSAYNYLGEYQKAIEFHNKSLQIVLQLGDRNGEETAYNNLGIDYISLGDYQQAIAFYTKALELDQKIGDIGGEGLVYTNLGNAYYTLGDYPKSIQFHTKALEVLQRIGDKKGAGAAYGNIGIAYASSGEFQKAIASHNQALQIATEIGDKQVQGNAYSNLGNVYSAFGDYPKAIEYSNKLLQIALEIGDKRGESGVYGNLGTAYENLKRYDEALPLEQKAISILTAIGAKQELYLPQWAIARILVAQDKPDLAILFYKEAVNTIQSTKDRIKALDPNLRKSFAESKSRVYRDLADLLLKQGRVLEAQKVLELLKEQETIEYLRSASQKSGGNAQLSDDEKKIWQDYQSLLGQDLELYRQRDQIRAQIQLIPAADREQSADYQKLKQARDAVQEKIDLQVKGFDVFLKKAAASIKSLDPSRTVENLQDDVTKYSKLLANGKAALISPLVLPDRLELILLTPKAKPIQRTVKVTKAELDKLILRLRQNLANPGTDTRADLRQLYTWLVAPFDAEIQQLVQDKTISTLVFAPDDNLRLIPMSALHDGKQYLVEKLPIGTVDRISSLANTALPSPQMLVMGLSKAQNNFPPLPSVPEEVKNIGKLYDGPVLLDERFTKANIQENLNSDQPFILHMATHGSFGINKDNTFILLFNGKLSLDDLKALELRNVSLLTLSACETAASDGRSGKGLAAAAEASGAQSVLGSLWSVNDASTSQLMQQFYTNLKSGLGKVESLRLAQLSLLRSQSQVGSTADRGGLGVTPKAGVTSAGNTQKGFADPFYWAPFILIGDWR